MTTIKCPKCHGRGKLFGRTCTTCKGEGELTSPPKDLDGVVLPEAVPPMGTTAEAAPIMKDIIRQAREQLADPVGAEKELIVAAAIKLVTSRDDPYRHEEWWRADHLWCFFCGANIEFGNEHAETCPAAALDRAVGALWSTAGITA